MDGNGQALSAEELDSLAPLLTTAEAAAILRVVPRMITKMCNAGDLKAVRVGNRWRINRDALLTKAGLK